MRRLAITLALALTTLGCNDPYGTAAKLAQDVAVSTNQANATIDAFRQQGIVTADEERTILGYLYSLNTVNGQYVACVQAAHNQSIAGGFTACANTLKVSMGDPTQLAALHVSNPTSQAKVTAVAQGIITLVTTTITALGGK